MADLRTLSGRELARLFQAATGMEFFEIGDDEYPTPPAPGPVSAPAVPVAPVPAKPVLPHWSARQTEDKT